MAQFCYVVRPCRPSLPRDATPDERAIIGAHFHYLKDLLAAGTVLFVGRCEDGTFGIAVYEAETETAAEAIMRDDPAVRQGVMTATLYPFRVALMRGMES